MTDQNNAAGAANNDQTNAGNQNPDNTQSSDNPNVNQNTDITNPEDGKGTDAGSQAPETQAPESYTDFTLPEGMQQNNALLDKAVPIFKELGLSQEAAQKLVDLQVEGTQSNDKLILETVEKWETELKADKDIGGDAFDENIGIANTAVTKLEIEGLPEFLESSGLGSHPMIVKIFWKIGNMMKEDSPGSGSAPAGQEKDTAAIMYPNDTPTKT